MVGKCWLLGKGFLISLFTVRGRPLETSDTKQRSRDRAGLADRDTGNLPGGPISLRAAMAANSL